MDKLSKYLRWIEQRKRDIIKQGKDRAEEWQNFFVFLERGSGLVDGEFRAERLTGEQKSERLWKILFVYEQIHFVQGWGRCQSQEKRKRTLAERYWREREKKEWALYRQGKNPKLVEEMPKFKNPPCDYPFPPPEMGPTKRRKLKFHKRKVGRPEREMRQWVFDVLKEPLRKLAPHKAYQEFRNSILGRLFALLQPQLKN